MSIGFIGAGTIQRTVDIFSGGGNRSVDVSLQNVLNKYDTIKTDLDRLVDQAQRGTYDITSRQHYNSYNKEAINGWSESWYSEYRAVLALRADALQKKMQAAYNRVLERSAYAEMSPDRDSVFAPYSNRTFKDDQPNINNLNDKMRIANVMMVDTQITQSTSTTTPTNYSQLWSAGAISSYLNNVDGTGFPAGRAPLTGYTDRATYYAYHSFSETSSGTDYADWRWPSGNTPLKAPPTAPHGYDGTTQTTRQNQRNAVAQAINDTLATWPAPPTTEPELSEYNANRDDAVEAGLQVADGLWKGGVNSSDDDGDGFSDDFRDYLSPTDFYNQVAQVVKSFKPNTGTGGVTPGTNTGGPEDLINAYMNGAASFDASNYMGLLPGDFRVQVPEFSMGDLISMLPPDVKDTIDTTTLQTIDMANINQLIQSFIGMQYNNIYKGNYYSSQPNASSIGIYTYGTANDKPFHDIQQADEDFPGGSVIQAGSTGIIPGIPSDDPNSQVKIPLTPIPLTIYLGFKGTIGPDLYYGHQSAIANTSSQRPVNNFSLPTIGLGSASVSIGIGPPGGVHGGVIINTSFSYDIMAKAFEEILKRLKTYLVEAMTVNSYATSSGTAMDSYASRAEYHFTSPGFAEAMKALNFDIPVLGIPIPFPLGSFANTLMFNGLPSPFGFLSDALGVGLLDNTDADSTYVNDQRLRERLFNYKHAVQGAESRETETGAFFATNAFLGQFEMSNMESEYWIGTQQNEEIVNMDLARAFTTSGAEIIKTLMASVASAMGVANPTGKSIIDGALKAIMDGMQDKALLNAMYDLMYRDQLGSGGSKGDFGNAVGQLLPGNLSGLSIGTRSSMQKSTFTSEAYDYIENDHKPFEGDSDFNYKQSGLLSGIPLIGDIFDTLFTANTPDFILEGIANTRRFTVSQWDSNITVAAVAGAGANQDAETGLGPRGYAGRGGGQYNTAHPYMNPSTVNFGSTNPAPDGNTGKGWDDTAMGDINEVYTATRKVVFNNLTYGFGEFSAADLVEDQITQADPTAIISSDLGASRTTTAHVERYVGADSRITERRYDGANGVDHETFSTNMYTAVDPNAASLGAGSNARKYYDRRNQYSLSFTTKADGNEYNLFGSQALNPTMGGFLKMGVIDKNKTDEAILAHNQSGMTGMKTKITSMTAAQRANMQNFGGASDGSLNEVNEMLYDHLHLRADGKNLSTIKEYRDVFETGLMKSIFISGQTYHPSGGGITSSLEIRYDSTQGRSALQTGTREDYNASSANFDPYNTPFLTRSRGQATMYLNTYFAYKKRATNNKT